MRHVEGKGATVEAPAAPAATLAAPRRTRVAAPDNSTVFGSGADPGGTPGVSPEWQYSMNTVIGRNSLLVGDSLIPSTEVFFVSPHRDRDFLPQIPPACPPCLGSSGLAAHARSCAPLRGGQERGEWSCRRSPAAAGEHSLEPCALHVVCLATHLAGVGKTLVTSKNWPCKAERDFFPRNPSVRGDIAFLLFAMVAGEPTRQDPSAPKVLAAQTRGDRLG